MDNTDNPESSRRRSGRVVRAPEKFSPEPQYPWAAPKRKRGNYQDGDDAENEALELGADQGMSGDDDGESFDGEPGPSRRKARPRKPAAKRVKTNGASAKSTGHAAALPSRPKKSVRIDMADEEGTELYASIFGSGDSSRDVAEQWLGRYQVDDAAAVTELINCVLQCTGCALHVTEDDIRDPENCDGRLTELQSLYQDQPITEYPLISRAKGNKSFRDLLLGFFGELVQLLHNTETLYSDEALMDNIHRWVASMSSSTLRPFRHTATTIALAIQTSLVEVAGTLDARISHMEQQIQGGRKVSKTKLNEMRQSLQEANSHREICSGHYKDFFETVFVHRYRDVDPRIRTESVEALGAWIWTLPTVFMQPEYLRYLGWMLSDVMHSTRHEVLKQLLRVFKRDGPQLGHFIERFRPRIVEMATKDSEISVRVAAIAVIEELRAIGMLEPDEIDAVGRLMFDSDLRIRKAVVVFFDACVQELIESKIVDLGGSEVIEEAFGVVEDDDYESPRKEWINIKCLGENLAAYDAQIESEQSDALNGLDVVSDLQAATPDTRVSLAAQVLYEKIPEVRRWDMLAGYLLHDHSDTAKPGSRRKPDVERSVFRAAAPDDQEEKVLLEVLAAAVKLALTQPADADKTKKKLARLETAESPEETAVQLASLIPRLLNKFGADAETATVVLRLEHFLDLDVFQQLRQYSSRYERLLDEIGTQFNRHDDKRVLQEATAALLHARQYEELEELTDSKLAVLWENVVNALREFDKNCELSVRGNLEQPELADLSAILTKISKLASIADCVDVLEAEGRSAESSSSTIDLLVDVVHRGNFEQPDQEFDDLEDEVATFAIRCCQFYFMWKVRGLSKLIERGAQVPAQDIKTLAYLKHKYWRHLVDTFTTRKFADQMGMFATGSFCDFHILFNQLRPYIRAAATDPKRAANLGQLSGLMSSVEPGIVKELIYVFDKAERSYARLAKKSLNEPAEDEDPIDDDDDEFDDDEYQKMTREEKLAAELKAEKALCELAGKLVLAIAAKVVDISGPAPGKLRRRLLRNQTRLGPNFKEITAFLDESKLGELIHGKKKAQKGKAAANRPQQASAPAMAEEVFEDAAPEEGSREDLRRRGLLEDELEEDVVDNAERANNHDADDDILGD